MSQPEPMRLSLLNVEAGAHGPLLNVLAASGHRATFHSSLEVLLAEIDQGEGPVCVIAADVDLTATAEALAARLGPHAPSLVHLAHPAEPSSASATARLPRGADRATIESTLYAAARTRARAIEVADLEQQVDALRESTAQQSAVVHHDLANPARVIAHVAEQVAQSELLSANGRLEIQSLVSAARGLARRVEGIPTVPARTPSHAVDTALRETVSNALTHIGVPASRVRWEPVDGDPVVHADPRNVRRVLEYLVADAACHAESLSVRVAAEGRSVRIEVLDRGTRYPSRSEDSAAIRFARSTLAEHGGEVSVRGREGGGTVVSTIWPGLVEVRSIGGAETDPDEGSGLDVWLIDDEPLVLRATSRLLKVWGHRPRSFGSGQAILEAAESGEAFPDAVICDADMPGMHGLEVLRRLRGIMPRTARILYTAHPATQAVIGAFNQGDIHRFIQKDEGPAGVEAALQAVSEEMQRDAHGAAQARLSNDLDELLSGDQLHLFLQPLFDAHTRRIVACEGLMRSKHPSFRGPLEILDAVRAFEQEVPLQASLSKRAEAIRTNLPDDVTLFLNIDPTLLANVERFDGGLSRLYPYADRIVLELTERARLGSDSEWAESVRRLRDLGFRIALDDVGAGYNSLGAVTAVQPEVIKLDISLISGIHRDTRKQELVRLLCDYARGFDIVTVAEGIEEAEEAAACADLGIRWLQGYHLARPMPFSDLRERHLFPPQAAAAAR